MGLFDKIIGDGDSSEENLNEKEEFKSIIVESENIPRELKSVAAANGLQVSELDFKILKIKTFFNDEKEDGWIEADNEKLKLLETDEFLLNKELKIKQSFKVEIYTIDLEEEQPVLPEIKLSGNKLLTRIIVNIKKNLNIKYFSKLEQTLVDEINKKKVKAGILVSWQDKTLLKEIKKLVANIRVNSVIPEDISFIACQGLDPIAPIHYDLIYHYKKKVASKDEQGRIDYSKRGFILAVEEGECIIEYIKPQEGRPGRNCQGKFLGVKEPKVDNETIITITENIAKKEDEERIKYVAKKSGYVNEPSVNSFDIDDNMEVKEISFRSTGSIETNLDSNVKINIKESDVFKDAIGPGMNVETSELDVEGNVGSGAKLKANKIEIGGQTHKTSIIEAKDAHIAVHRGQFIGTNVKIDRLEGGKIIADEIHIKNAIGGEIIGKKILIDELSSNATIVSSERIEIKEIKGTDNKFLIDPSSTKEFNAEIEKIKTEIKDIKLSIKPIPKQLEERKRLIAKTKPAVNMVKEKIEELKSGGKKPPVTLFSKIKEFQNMVNGYNALLKEYKNKQDRVKNLHKDLNEVQMKVFSAKVINHSPWLEYNEVKFKLMSPEIEVSYTTKDHEIIREMTLEQVGEEEYKIKKSSEYTD